VDLLGVTLEMYRLTPADFTAARNTWAKEAASAGDRVLAADIRALPKPSAPAWALNQLAHELPKTAKDFTTLGVKLRQAQQRADRSQLSELVQQRKVLIGRTSKEIQSLANKSGVRLSASALIGVEQSLLAALADEAGEVAVFSGRLVRSIQSDGLEPVDLVDAVAGPPLRYGTRAGSSSEVSAPEKAAKPTAARTRTLEALAARAQKAAEAADAALEAVRQREASAKSDRQALSTEVAALQEKLDRLEQRQAVLDDQAAGLNRDLRTAIAAARDAHIAAEKAAETH
jgi:hypothetical protein